MSEQKEFFIPPGYDSTRSEGPNVSVPGYTSKLLLLEILEQAGVSREEEEAL